MIPFDLCTWRGAAGEGRSAGVRAALRELRRRGADGRLLSLTAFFPAESAREWRRAKDGIEAAVREFFGGRSPPLTLVAEPPADGRPVVLEAALLARGAGPVRLTRRWGGSPAWTRLEDGEVRQIHAGGLGTGPDAAGPEAGAEAAFADLGRVLAAEGLDHGHLVRQWNYLEGLLEGGTGADGGGQGYQAFNEVRAREYARSVFRAGYPASTGIGQSAGGVAMEFVALDAPGDVRIEAVSNPEQVDAHRYSGRVLVGGGTGGAVALEAPRFERAKRIARGGRETVFLSGTAAVIGEESVAPGDVRAQTRTAAAHLLSLTRGRPPGYLRAYVKRAADAAAVREVCREILGAAPEPCLVADVCRDELLVELEGILVAGPEGGR